MNHTDRFNYFPFMYKMWKLEAAVHHGLGEGEVLRNPVVGTFMELTSNLPTVSRVHHHEGLRADDGAAAHGGRIRHPACAGEHGSRPRTKTRARSTSRNPSRSYSRRNATSSAWTSTRAESSIRRRHQQACSTAMMRRVRPAQRTLLRARARPARVPSGYAVDSSSAGPHRHDGDRAPLQEDDRSHRLQRMRPRVHRARCRSENLAPSSIASASRFTYEELVGLSHRRAVRAVLPGGRAQAPRQVSRVR